MIEVVGIAILVFYVALGYKKPSWALISVPVLAVTIVLAAVGYEQESYFAFALVLVLATLISITISERQPAAQQWFHKWAFWMLVIVAVSTGLGVLIATCDVLGMTILLPMVFILAAVAIVGVLISYGLSQRDIIEIQVFTTLAGSMRQNLPLPMALECAAHGRETSLTWILRNIKKWLVQGYPLVESIRRGYPHCRAQALALLTAAERLGQVPAAVAAISRDAEARTTERNRIRPVHPAYPLVVLCVMFLLLLGLITFVIPQYKAVIEEMVGGRLPYPTRVLIDVVDFLFYEYEGLPFLLLLGLVFVVAPAFWLRGRFRRRRPSQPYLSSQIGDFIRWHLPLAHWFERNSGTLQTVEFLRLGAKAGCPVNEAIRGTLELDVNLCYRRRLARWLRRVEQGENIAAAARRCRLGTPLAWAFEAAGATDDPALILESLESFYRSNYSFRINLVRFIVWPLVVLGLAGVVGFVVVAMFLPGVQILGALT